MNQNKKLKDVTLVFPKPKSTEVFNFKWGFVLLAFVSYLNLFGYIFLKIFNEKLTIFWNNRNFLLLFSSENDYFLKEFRKTRVTSFKRKTKIWPWMLKKNDNVLAKWRIGGLILKFLFLFAFSFNCLFLLRTNVFLEEN